MTAELEMAIQGVPTAAKAREDLKTEDLQKKERVLSNVTATQVVLRPVDVNELDQVTDQAAGVASTISEITNVVPAEHRTAHPRTASMSDTIALFLVVGVVISAATLLLGVALLTATGHTGYGERLTPQLLLSPQGAVQFPHDIGETVRGVLALKPFAIIELGALFLIATPVFRVAASAVLFLIEKDRLYAVITLAVLVLLLVSVFCLGWAA